MFPKDAFKINQVVFIEKDKEEIRPAKVLSKSSYGTYKIKYFGEKEEYFACQYEMKKFCEKIVLELLKDGKRSKKYIKFLKAAEKENANFLSNLELLPIPKIIKEQQQMEQQVCNLHENASLKMITKYEAISNIKVSDLISDCQTIGQTVFSLPLAGKQGIFREPSKQLLIKRLGWSLQDISLNKLSVQTQKNVCQILESEVIEPVEFVTSCLWRKLNEAIDSLKKNRLKNYLVLKQNEILGGFQIYLNNYSVFLRIQYNFCEFLNGKGRKEKQSKAHESMFESYQEPKI